MASAITAALVLGLILSWCLIIGLAVTICLMLAGSTPDTGFSIPKIPGFRKEKRAPKVHSDEAEWLKEQDV